MSDILIEVERFRAWAAAHARDGRHGEWECDYENWNDLYSAVTGLADERREESCSAAEISATVYAIARDNETEYLANEVRKQNPKLLLDLAEMSLEDGEPEAKWQFAEQLGQLSEASQRNECLLLAFAHDENEYVRRRALQSLARIASRFTEQVALEAWSRPDESQQYSRMMALWALHRIGSQHLDRLLSEAERDKGTYLAAYAAKTRAGDIEP